MIFENKSSKKKSSNAIWIVLNLWWRWERTPHSSSLWSVSWGMCRCFCKNKWRFDLFTLKLHSSDKWTKGWRRKRCRSCCLHTRMIVHAWMPCPYRTLHTHVQTHLYAATFLALFELHLAFPGEFAKNTAPAPQFPHCALGCDPEFASASPQMLPPPLPCCLLGTLQEPCKGQSSVWFPKWTFIYIGSSVMNLHVLEAGSSLKGYLVPLVTSQGHT